MPNYDYECTKCHLEFEISHNIRDDAHTHKQHIKQGSSNTDCNGKLKRLVGGNIGVTWKGGVPTPKTYL